VTVGAPSYKGFRFPAEIISYCVWLCHRFPLSSVRCRRGSVASVKSKIRQAWSMRHRSHRVPASRSGFAGFRFPPDVITLAVR
jgi:hypothetical protein